MADLKISQLSSATALAGTEVVPVVQGGSTKKATIDQILAPASGKGIDFSAAGGDTLSMYDEGTFASTLLFGGSNTGMSYNAQGGWYTRVGNTVHFTIFIQLGLKGSSTGAVTVGGLPFTSKNTNSRKYSINVTGQSLTGLTGALFGVLNENDNKVYVYQSDATGGTALTDAAFTQYSSDNLIVTGTYQV